VFVLWRSLAVVWLLFAQSKFVFQHKNCQFLKAKWKRGYVMFWFPSGILGCELVIGAEMAGVTVL